MPKPIKKKITKKITDTETEVKERIITLKETLRERQRYLLRYFFLGLVIIIAISGVIIYEYSLRKKAMALALDAYKTYHNIYQKQTLDRTGQISKSLEMFNNSYHTKKSPVVLLYIINCYYELGIYDEALRKLKEFTERYSGKDKLIPLAYIKMSDIYLKKGDIKEAKKSLEKIYSLKGEIYKDFALIKYAKLLEKEGEVEEAKKKYKELIEKFPNSPFRSEAEAKLSVNK